MRCCSRCDHRDRGRDRLRRASTAPRSSPASSPSGSWSGRFAIDEVPSDFTSMTPYVITLLVLAFASQRLRMPAADGQIYRKECWVVAAEDSDWEALTAAAAEASRHAYAPYCTSGRGGRDGRRRRVLTGCNVENAAYGVGLCAECGLVNQLHLTGGGG